MLSCFEASPDRNALAPGRDAQQRADYVASIKQGGLLGTEYHTIRGTALLRVTGELTPSANEPYATAFKEMTR